ncbi:MAG TPA: alpha/beta fold hydrolase [Thermoanaerobaculia bacterium]|nr:alpha/beta fold hydrolase [Thermoanaerobaculia bacterium]
MRLLLLHGAGLGGWIWERVLPSLRAPAAALELPGRGGGRDPGEVTLEECVAFVAGEIERAGRAIVVGHSIGASVAMAAAARRPEHVPAIVLVGGMVPESGKPFLSLLPPPARLVLRLMLRRAKNGIALPPSLVRKEYCNDLDEATTELVMRKLTPEVPRLYLDAVEWSSLPDRVPRTYVKLLNDRSVKPAKQDAIAARTGASVVTIDSGHLPMLARPAELAAVLNELSAR